MTIVDAVRDRMPHYTCPVCNRGLRGSTVTLVSETATTSNVRIVCGQCNASFVIVLAAAEQWAEEVGPVSIAEVVAVRDWLERWIGGPLTDLTQGSRRLGPGASFNTDAEPEGPRD